MKPTKKPSSIRLQDDIKVWAYQLAFKERRSLSSLINKILSEYKEQQEGHILTTPVNISINEMREWLKDKNDVK